MSAVGLVPALVVWAALVPETAGASWSIESIPSPAGATYSLLNGVSCPKPHECVAVGEYTTTAQTGAMVPAPGQVPFDAVTLAERRDPSGWHIQGTPNPAGSHANQLWAVSCATLDACTAVGSYSTESGEQTALAEHWDGSSWTIEPTPRLGPITSPAGSVGAVFSGVSCPTTSDCTAVGTYQVGYVGAGPREIHTLAEHWNGATWSIEPTPEVAGEFSGSAGSPAFTGVSCPALGDCTAVGNYPVTTSGPTELAALAERWDGSTWEAQTLPTPRGSDTSSLQAVSCPSGAACTAVGYADSFGPGPSLPPLAERWNGATWQIQSIAKPPGGQLQGVSCATVTTCTAVGYFFGGPPGALASTVAEGWDGLSWNSESLLAGGPVSGFLSVSCPQPQACTGVGATGSAANTLQGAALGEQVNVAPVRGAVLVAVPAAKGAHFVRLTRERRIPVGAQLDTTHGAVSVTSAINLAGATQTGEFYGGQFKVMQKRAVGALTELRLTGKLDCTGVPRHPWGLASAARRRPHRRLWGKENGGHFGTAGRYGSALVRGAEWLTDDSCTGTRFTVVRGVATVTDLVRHRTLMVRAGHSYLAGH